MPPTENYRTDYGGIDEEIMEDDFDYAMEVNELKNISRMEKPVAQMKLIVDANDDLTALLEEEENLVNAHRKQVEETMDIAREEMNLLVEVDQPGNQLDSYITKLNIILSQKASMIQQLQTQLHNFQKHLEEYNVLSSASCGN